MSSQELSQNTKKTVRFFLSGIFIASLIIMLLLFLNVADELDRWKTVDKVSFFLSNGDASVKILNLPGKDFLDVVDEFDDADFTLTSEIDTKPTIVCVIDAKYQQHMTLTTKISCVNTVTLTESQVRFVVNGKDDYFDQVMDNLYQAIADLSGNYM